MLWDELCEAWRACFEQTWKAYREGSRPIGACITDRAGNVLAVGHNRMAQPNLEMPYLHNSRLAHAEMNAMLHLASRMQNESEPAKLEVRELILWTTTEPCPLCISAAVMMNLRTLKYAAREPWAGSLEILEANRYLASKKVKVQHPENTVFETILVALHTEMELRESNDLEHPILKCCTEFTPRAVELGKRLFLNGQLEQLRNFTADPREALNALEQTANRHLPSLTV
jgi:tRNA(adenine34) deaminase